MSNPLYLDPSDAPAIKVLDDISVVNIQLIEHTALKTVKRRTKVYKNNCIATHPSPNIGDLHAPFDGIIKNISASFIEIEAAVHEANEETEESKGSEESKGKEEAGKENFSPTSPVSFDGLDRLALSQELKKLGISVRRFLRECDTLIINCLNPEPGTLYTQELLKSYMPTIQAGFEMVKRLSDASTFVLALPKGSPYNLEGAESQYLKAVYPISLARPLINTLMKTESTKHYTMVRLYNLFALGLVAQSGLPLTEIVITALGKNYIAPLGTPTSYFFEKNGIMPSNGDSVVLGGTMRGHAIANINRGISKGDDALHHGTRNSMPKLEDNPCMNCGACVSVCPMHLRPNMLSRYVEFEQYEKCRDEYIESCIECGMCAYICPACRPIQQYFRIAKHKLNINSHQYISGQ